MKADKEQQYESAAEAERMKKNRRIFTVIAIAAVLLQLLAVSYVFQYQKEGEHSDELWGYGLANSYYEPYIFMSADTYETTYENEWVEGSVFRDYITVKENQRFSYGSVISNLKKDTAPPLYCLLLHTVCSFFPGTFSLWYGFSINLLAFAVTQLFLYMLVKKITSEDYRALLVILLYGFSVGAVSTAIFIRHYMLLTMFTVMTMYFHYLILKDSSHTETRDSLKDNNHTENKANPKDGRRKIAAYAGLCLSVAGGALSHYFYFVFLAVMAVLYLLYFCLKKKWQKAALYLAVTVFPVLVTSPLSNARQVLGLGTVARGVKTIELLESGVFSGILGMISQVFNFAYNPMFDVNVNIVLECILYDLFGITADVRLPYWFLHLLYLAVFLLLMLLMLSVLVKKHKTKAAPGAEVKQAESAGRRAEVKQAESAGRRAEVGQTERAEARQAESAGRRAEVKQAVSAGRNAETKQGDSVKAAAERGKILRWLEKPYDFLAGISVNRFYVLTLLCAAAFEIYIVIGIAQPYRMNASTNRYLFMVYPVIYLLLMLAVTGIPDMGKRKSAAASAAVRKAIAVVLTAAILIVNNVNADSIYLFPRPEGEKRMEDMVGGSDCVLMVSTHWLMTCYVNYLKEAEDIFVTDCNTVYDQKELLGQADTEEVYLILDVDEFENTLMLRYHCEREEVSRGMAEEFYMSFFKEAFEGKTIEYVSMDNVFQRNVYIYRVY